jgi:hypothetical protein
MYQCIGSAPEKCPNEQQGAGGRATLRLVYASSSLSWEGGTALGSADCARKLTSRSSQIIHLSALKAFSRKYPSEWIMPLYVLVLSRDWEVGLCIRHPINV